MYKKFIKRFIDVIISLVALPIFFILFVFISPFIYFSDKGTIFYNSLRLGRDGKVFKMYKFRTMKMNSPDIRNKDGSTFNSETDPRLTRIGKILRKTSLDETPQILNVLFGSMSLIGPRPDLPEHYELYDLLEKKKLVVKPGITGLNQAYFRNTIPWKERIKNDIKYVEKMSLVFDIKIFLKTIIIIFKKNKVYINERDYESKN